VRTPTKELHSNLNPQAPLWAPGIKDIPPPKPAWGDEDMQDSQSSSDEMEKIWRSVQNVSLETVAAKTSAEKDKRTFRVPASLLKDPSPFPEAVSLIKVIGALFGVEIEPREDIPQDWSFISDDLRHRVQQIVKFLLLIVRGEWKDISSGVFARKYEHLGLAVASQKSRWGNRQFFTFEKALEQWLSQNLTVTVQCWFASMPGHILNAIKHWFRMPNRISKYLHEFLLNRKLPPVGRKTLADSNVQFFERIPLEADNLLQKLLKENFSRITKAMETPEVPDLAVQLRSEVWTPDVYFKHLDSLSRGGHLADLSFVLCTHSAFKQLGRDRNGAFIRRMRHFKDGKTAETLPQGLTDDALSRMLPGEYRELARKLGKLPDPARTKRPRSLEKGGAPEGLGPQSTDMEVVSRVSAMLKAQKILPPNATVSTGQILSFLATARFTEIKVSDGKTVSPSKDVKAIKQWYLKRKEEQATKKRAPDQSNPLT